MKIRKLKLIMNNSEKTSTMCYVTVREKNI